VTTLPFFQQKVALPNLGLTPVGSASVAKKRQSCVGVARGRTGGLTRKAVMTLQVRVERTGDGEDGAPSGRQGLGAVRRTVFLGSRRRETGGLVK
jgi:hypothetical protein